MRFGDSARDGQTQSQAATIGTPRLPEAIEQSCAVLLRNTRTGVGYRDMYAAISNAAADRDRAATGRELERIANEVVEQLKDTLAVGGDDHSRRAAHELEIDGFLGGASPK